MESQQYEEDLAYTFGCPEGSWPGRLDLKEWGRNGNLQLYFTHLETDERYVFGVFFNNLYRPRKSGPNFHDDVEEGECFMLETALTRTGKPKLVTATPLEEEPDSEPDESLPCASQTNPYVLFQTLARDLVTSPLPPAHLLLRRSWVLAQTAPYHGDR